MSHLVAISVGPVQEFIAAARRTRDLWFGSYLLSEISKAVAKSVKEQGGDLIFPHPESNLTPGNDRVNVANIILADLPSAEPGQVVVNAKQAAKERWLEFAGMVQPEIAPVIRQEIWEDQINDVIEFYSAWISRSANYQSDRTSLMRLLSGRKNLRNFLPAKGRAGVPKSSLDGQRESVLKDPGQENWPNRFRARLRLRQGEQLDVVGWVKRVAEGNRPYPSVSRIAADPWIRGNAGEESFNQLLRSCQSLPADVLHRLDVANRFPQYAVFPFEGTAVFVNRHHEWEEEVDEVDRPRIGELQKALGNLPEPSPYLAVLVADGDKMGAAISALTSPDENREFSETLAGFADEAHKIVSRHNGVLVYAGGDDVLAFVPVDKSLVCARELHDDFGTRLRKYGNPTLSVGVAIGHFMENLEDLLSYGREAEKAAKLPDRDGLAVHLHKRGGGPIRIRSSWKERPDELLTRLADLLLAEAIPGKLPYELRNLAQLYSAWHQDSEEDRSRLAVALQKDVIRVTKDKQPRSGRQRMPEIEKIVQAIDCPLKLTQFSDQLLVARQIAVALAQASKKANSPEEATTL